MDAGLLAPPRTAQTVALGLGSNVGDRRQNLRLGMFALLMHPEIRVAAISRVWETEHVGGDAQAPHYNLVCLAATRLAPTTLLAVCKGIEERLGRPAGGHGLPRTLDIDILLYGERCGAARHLVLPHPGLSRRGFVLGPLAELAPQLPLPDSGQTVGAAWASIQDQAGPWLQPLDEPLLDRRAPADDEREWRAALAVHCR